MPKTATKRRTVVVRIPASMKSLILTQDQPYICKMHAKTNCGVMLDPNGKTEKERGKRKTCLNDYHKLWIMADGKEKRWRAFEMMGWCAPPQRDEMKRLYSELVEFEKEVAN